MEPVPTTPGIREVRPESGSGSFGFCTEPGGSPVPGIRRFNLRAEIDTSPPFGSVQEAVTRFGGGGSWVPYFKAGEAYNGLEEFDVKKVEEKAAELEKDLIVKELETLDILEALGSTKRIVEDLKKQLQQEALKCMATPDFSNSDIKEMNVDHCSACQGGTVENSGAYPLSSPDVILMELKQARLNLGKIINNLGAIQSSIESLNKKMKKERAFLRMTRMRLTYEFAGAASLAEELKQMREKPGVPVEADIENGFDKSPRVHREDVQMNPPKEQVKRVAESTDSGVPAVSWDNEQSKTCLYTAEMRLVAARKLEEAARAAEALAIAEMNVLSNGDKSPAYFLPEPVRSPLITPRAQNAVHGFPEASISRISILKSLDEATEEVKLSKQALENALSRVENANRKQFAAEEALRRWTPRKEKKRHVLKDATKLNAFHPMDHNQKPFFSPVNKPEQVNEEELKPMLKPTISMRDVLGRKQMPSDDFDAEAQTERQGPKRNMNLSQMLQELREDIKFPTRAEREKDPGEEKQPLSQKKKFGFIHISLPLRPKHSKKGSQLLSTTR